MTSYFYQLYDNNRLIYSNSKFEYVAHEYLSLLMNTKTFDSNNIYISAICSTDDNKKYLFETDRYIYMYDTNWFTSTYTGSVVSVSENLVFIVKQFREVYKSCHEKKPTKVKKNVSSLSSKNFKITKKNSVSKSDNLDISDSEDLEDITNTSESEISKQIRQLEEEKRSEELKLEKIKQNEIDEEAKKKKQAEDLAKEKMELNKRKFTEHLNVYTRICADLRKKRFTEDNIPALFRQEYPIIKFMEQNSHLDFEYAFELFEDLYLDLYKNLEPQKTRNMTYNEYKYFTDDEETKNKYINFVIDSTKTPLKSIDTIMAELDRMDANDSKTENTNEFIPETNQMKQLVSSIFN
jgi:hypothetical protein